MSNFFFLYQSKSSFCTVFDGVSSNHYDVLPIIFSSNISVLGEFNVDRKAWLPYRSETDSPGELHENISLGLTQVVNVRTGILYLGSFNFAHVVVSFFIDFTISSKEDVPFRCTAFNHSQVNFLIVSEMFHGRISLIWVLILFLLKLASSFRLKLM